MALTPGCVGTSPSFGPPATLIALLGLLAFAPACAYAVSQDAKEERVSRILVSPPTLLVASLTPYAYGGHAPSRVMRAPLSGSGCSTTLGRELGKTQQRPMVGTVAPPKPDTFSPNSISLCYVTVALARRATRPRPPCGMRARLRMAMRGLNMTWHSFIRRAKACRAISTWRRSWYAAAAAHGLSAAALKLASLREERRRPTVSLASANPTLAPAVPTGPPVASASGTGKSVQIELSWAAPAQPVPVEFFVQVLALDTGGAHRVFTSFSKQSAVLGVAAAGSR